MKEDDEASYQYDCLVLRACLLAPINHDNSLSNWRRHLDADTLDEPWNEKKTRENEANQQQLS